MRPDHFRGVATVVCKLLGIVRPDALYLGQKDAQQTAVLRKMIADLEIPVNVVTSSPRSANPTASRSRAATSISPPNSARLRRRCITRCKRCVSRWRCGNSKADAIDGARTRLDPLAQLDYLDVVDANTFAPIETLSPPAFVIGAARFGSTRLLDNLWIE